MTTETISTTLERIIPVFGHYISQLDQLLDRLGDTDDLLTRALAKDSFSAGVHFCVAQGFVVRTLYPPLGLAIPALAPDGSDRAALRLRNQQLLPLIETLHPQDYTGVEVVRHRAGQGEIVQPSNAYVMIFGMPNFFFHWTMGYGSLRAAGLALGKADFDGLHVYEKGFSWLDQD